MMHPTNDFKTYKDCSYHIDDIKKNQADYYKFIRYVKYRWKIALLKTTSNQHNGYFKIDSFYKDMHVFVTNKEEIGEHNFNYFTQNAKLIDSHDEPRFLGTTTLNFYQIFSNLIDVAAFITGDELIFFVLTKDDASIVYKLLFTKYLFEGGIDIQKQVDGKFQHIKLEPYNKERPINLFNDLNNLPYKYHYSLKYGKIKNQFDLNRQKQIEFIVESWNKTNKKNRRSELQYVRKIELDEVYWFRNVDREIMGDYNLNVVWKRKAKLIDSYTSECFPTNVKLNLYNFFGLTSTNMAVLMNGDKFISIIAADRREANSIYTQLFTTFRYRMDNGLIPDQGSSWSGPRMSDDDIFQDGFDGDIDSWNHYNQ